MTKVFKYRLAIATRQVVEVQGIRVVLSVAVQHDDLVLYALVNLEDKHVGCVDVLIKGTGHDIVDPLYDWEFMGSHVTHEGELVWHVWINNAIMYKHKEENKG